MFASSPPPPLDAKLKSRRFLHQKYDSSGGVGGSGKIGVPARRIRGSASFNLAVFYARREVVKNLERRRRFRVRHRSASSPAKEPGLEYESGGGGGGGGVPSSV